MGLIRVATRVRGLNGRGKPFKASFLVDTGAIDCLVPKDRLRAAGAKPEGTATYELASGEPVDYDYGYARFEFMGEDTIARVIFGPPGVEPILGALALESAGIMIDPVTQTLKRLPRRSLK
jgi:clan AA aspartic protease